MEFDLFDAMKQLRKNFGNECELLLTNENFGIGLKLRVFQNGEIYSSGFAITDKQISQNSDAPILNCMFRDNIKDMKRALSGDDYSLRG